MRGYAAIGLVGTKNGSNVGGVMRAAFCYDAALIVIQGERYKRFSTDTSATARHIPLLHGNVLDLIPHDCVPVAIEIVDGARSLPAYTHPERAFYIFGPEDNSISSAILKRCRDVVSIPTRACLNLAATVNVVLYDRLQKQATRKP